MHIFNGKTALACLAAALPISGLESPVPEVHIGQGTTTIYGPVFTQDISSTGIAAFKGIPYAEPPVGDLRWRSPIPPRPWIDPLNTTDFGNACYGFLAGWPTVVPESEDCLFLNIWTGMKNRTERRPVMVWIHGGGWLFDSSTNPAYNGSLLAEKGVVMVSVEYRVGTFGYLARKDLDAEDAVGNSGNYGVQDMIFALRWVKDNIHAFGGDPENVLVFGESSGASAMGILMASPLADGLYHKAAFESSALWNSEHGNMLSFEEARRSGEAWGQTFGENTTLVELRNLSAEMVVSSSPFNPLYDPVISPNVFTPAVDGYVIPVIPDARFIAGEESKVPMLAGFNGDEGAFFAVRAFPHDNASEWLSYESDLFAAPGKNKTMTAQEINKFYPTSSIPDLNSTAVLQIGDLAIAAQTWYAASLHSQNSQQSSFLYFFNFTSARNPLPIHTTEIAYVFGTLSKGAYIPPAAASSAADIALSESMMTYWTNFAKSGNPNLPETLNGNLVDWPIYIADDVEGHVDIAKTGVRNLLLEFGQTTHVPRYDFGRFQFINSFRDDFGNFPAHWRTSLFV